MKHIFYWIPLILLCFQCESRLVDKHGILFQSLEQNNMFVLSKIHQNSSEVERIVRNNGNKKEESKILDLIKKSVKINNDIVSSVLSEEKDENKIKRLIDSLDQVRLLVFQPLYPEKCTLQAESDQLYATIQEAFNKKDSLKAQLVISQSSFLTIKIINELASHLSAPFYFDFCRFDVEYEVDSISPDRYMYTLVVKPAGVYNPPGFIRYDNFKFNLKTNSLRDKTIGNTCIITFEHEKNTDFEFNCQVYPLISENKDVNNIITSGCKISFRSDNGDGDAS